MIEERFLPTYDVHEIHRRAIRATPEHVFQAIKEVTVGEIALLSTLYGLRDLPARLLGRTAGGARKDDVSRKSYLAKMLAEGFFLLDEKPNQELVVGTIGQFWNLTSGSGTIPIVNAQDFLTFDQPGYAKAVIDFRLEESEDGKGVMLTTETRVLSMDAETRRKFAWYWRLIYLGSSLIRYMWLGAIKHRAEGGPNRAGAYSVDYDK